MRTKIILLLFLCVGAIEAQIRFKPVDKIEYELWGKEVPIKVLPFLQAQLLGQYLRGDIPEYPPFTDWR